MFPILERYLGVDPSPAGEGISWTWTADPPVAVGAAGPYLLLAVLAVTVLTLFRRDLKRVPGRAVAGIVVLRVMSLSLITLMICRVTLNVMRTGDAVVALMVDTSASMGVADEYEPDVRRQLAPWLVRGRGTRRIDLVEQLLERDDRQWLRRLAERRRLELFPFAEELGEERLLGADDGERLERGRRLTFAPTGTRTNLRGSLTSLLNRYRGSPPAAVVIFTDGVSTTGAENGLSEGAGLARRMQVPLYVVGVGSARAVKDVAIEEVRTDAVAFVGDSHSFAVRLAAARLGSGKTNVVLSLANEPEVLDSAEVTFREGESDYTVELSHVPQSPGVIDYDIVVQPVAGESNLQNNRAQARVAARQQRLQVLLIDRIPRWEFRHIKGVLERDRTVELRTWLEDADAEFVREDRTAVAHLPAQLEDLAEYDAVILGDVAPDDLPVGFAGVLREFVRELGGGLFLIAGPGHLPVDYFDEDWEQLLPIAGSAGASQPLQFLEQQGSRAGVAVRATLEGRAHPILKLGDPGRRRSWTAMPPLYAGTEPVQVKASAQVLLEGMPATGGPARPLLVTHRYGAGVVLIQLFDETWRWRSVDDGLPFRRYWSQVVRHLSKRKAIEDHPIPLLRTDRVEYVSGEVVKLTLTGMGFDAGAESFPVVVVGPESQTRSVTLKAAAGDFPEYAAQIDGLSSGSYSARPLHPVPGGPPLVANWRVLSIDPERVFQPMNERDLRLAAQNSGGKFYGFGEAAQIPDDIPPGRSRRLEQRQTIPLWNRWDTVLALAATLLGEWALRKRYRLV